MFVLFAFHTILPSPFCTAGPTCGPAGCRRPRRCGRSARHPFSYGAPPTGKDAKKAKPICIRTGGRPAGVQTRPALRPDAFVRPYRSAPATSGATPGTAREQRAVKGAVRKRQPMHAVPLCIMSALRHILRTAYRSPIKACTFPSRTAAAAAMAVVLLPVRESLMTHLRRPSPSACRYRTRQALLFLFPLCRKERNPTDENNRRSRNCRNCAARQPSLLRLGRRRAFGRARLSRFGGRFRSGFVRRRRGLLRLLR